MTQARKPLGRKSYGHIPHLPGSRIGAGDHTCHEGQARIATEKVRDRHDDIIVQEKLDGSNVGVARIDGVICPLTRAGYLASTSPFEQHHHFSAWVYANQERFLAVLEEGERLCGEWLMQAHGTRYNLPHEPFVAFDLMLKTERMPYDPFCERIRRGKFVTPKVLHRGDPLSIERAMQLLNTTGFHGALDAAEGAVWRVERNQLIHPGKGSERRWGVDFLVKYVRPDKVDGHYLPELSGKEPVWNWHPRGEDLEINSEG
ncbi:MAG: RNA ligase family protein [bacterium]